MIVATNDFPSDILPWVRLSGDGVIVKQIAPGNHVLTAEEISRELTARTRVVCLTWVHSFSGHVIDLDAIGELCRSVGAVFVVNAAQGVGALPLRVDDHPIDAVTAVGFKYLCGPYGTGFCWLGDRLIDQLQPAKLYWLSALTADDLAKPELDLASLEPPSTAARHDVFGTANFFNFAALTEAVDLISTIGVDQIFQHNVGLSDRLAEGIDPARYMTQPRGPADRRSSMLLVKPVIGTIEDTNAVLSAAGVDIALRSGMVRFSPHLYNTVDDIDRAVDALS